MASQPGKQKHAPTAFNQPTGVTSPAMTATYTYRADGLRHAKTVNGVVTQHVWRGMHIVLERNASVVINNFVRDLNGNLIRCHRNGFYLFNARGDVVQLTNAAGAVIRTYRYDAFGNEINPNPPDDNPFRFAGEYFDSHRGEYYLRARTFNPRTGRFTQPDPYWGIHNMQDSTGAILQAANLYVFVTNNPIMFIDPWGLNRAYIFYDPNILGEGTGNQRAAAMRSQINSRYDNVELITLSTFANFERSWRNMVDAEFVAIFAHGNESAMTLYSSYVKGKANPAGQNSMFLWDIESLAVRDVGVVVLLSCLTGNETRTTDNIARAFMRIGAESGGVRSVVAPSGPLEVQFNRVLGTFRMRDLESGLMLYTRNDSGWIQRNVLFEANNRITVGALDRELRNRGIVS